MNTQLFFSLITFLGFGSLFLGWHAKRQTKTKEDYFLMGRKMGLFSLVMTFLATQIGGGALMGAAEEAYTQGWKVIFYPLGMMLGLLVLGLGYGAKIRKLGLTTISEIFEKFYHSPRLRQIASLLSIASLLFVLVGQGVATRKLFISIGSNGNLLFVLFWLVLILYTVMGGLKAVVKTDILQSSFILIIFAIAIGATYGATLPEKIEPIKSVTKSTPWSTWLLMPLLFTLIGQDMGQRCFAAKSARTVSLAACLAGGLLFLVSLVPIYFGALGGKHGVAISEGSSVLITTIHTFTGSTISTLSICAVLVAIISTADSLLCSVSSNISYDFPRFKSSVFASRIITFLVGVLTLVLSFFFDNVLSVFMTSYEMAASVLFVPITMAIWLKKPKKRSAILAMSVGFLCFLMLQRRTFSFPRELITLTCSFGVFMASEWFEKFSIKLTKKATSTD